MTVLDDGSSSELHEAILHQAELYLDGQLRLAIATQARATTLTSIFLPSSIALFGAAQALGGGAAIQWAGSVSAIMLLISALFCMFAAVKPSFLGVPGSEPRLSHGTMSAFFHDELEYYQCRINNNDPVIKQYVYWLRFGAATAASAPVLGAATYFLWDGIWSALASLRC